MIKQSPKVTCKLVKGFLLILMSLLLVTVRHADDGEAFVCRCIIELHKVQLNLYYTIDLCIPNNLYLHILTYILIFGRKTYTLSNWKYF